MVNINKSNFLQESNRLINQLPTAAFCAIDLQITGTGFSTAKWNREDTPSERYARIKELPERYAIVQLGVALFHENPEYRQYMYRKKKRRLTKQEYIDENSFKRNEGERQNGVEDDKTEKATKRTSLVANFDRVVNRIDEKNINDNDAANNVNNDISGGSENSDSAEDDDSSVDYNEPPEFLVNKYNFSLFPPSCDSGKYEREVVLKPGSLSFFKESNMDFNTWIRQGVPYTTLDHAEKIINTFYDKHKKKEEEYLSKNKDTLSKKGWFERPSEVTVEPSTPEDVAFVARSMAELREWIDSASHSHRGNFDYNISSIDEENEVVSKLIRCDTQLHRTCLRQIISYEYPSLLHENAPPPHDNWILVLRLNGNEKNARDEWLRREEWKQIHTNEIGFTRVFKAISDACHGKFTRHVGNLTQEYHECLESGNLTSNIGRCHYPNLDIISPRPLPIIVHNGFMNLLFMITHFHAHSLPDSYLDAKNLIRQYFPLIYDTKVLAVEYSASEVRHGITTLPKLFSMTSHVNASDIVVQIYGNRFQIMNFGMGVMNLTVKKESAYSAFMIGAVFHGLSRRILGSAKMKCWMENHTSSIGSQHINERNDGFGTLKFLDERHSCNQYSSYFGRNLLHLMHTLYTIDLNKCVIADSMCRGMSLMTTFRVSGVDAAVGTDDILRILKHLRDPKSYKNDQSKSSLRATNFNCKSIAYEILW
eukprot:CAMPEP_0184865800 /NCGR_PEP_ID=MMETSP0580-20130426/19125_1 /TAXON_ID=1118495 /ORGANISM="Dactyliosolen fragilissimus" /LENGTH=707 /DNA_ID=CAMNT_0027365129 /DNA_START=55 /DNA_END=2175 /DNA_ORIENTATION=-